MGTDDHQIGEVYEAIADWFDQNRTKTLLEKPWLDALLDQIRPNPSVLDLGCGTGEPIASYLIERGCQLTGVDGSSKMIARCRERFPDQVWLVADMRTLSLSRTFDAVIAWDSFFHLDHEAQRSMMDAFAHYTSSGGVVLFNSGSEHGVAYGEMNGHVVYHASLDAADYRSILNEHGFTVLRHTVDDPECGGRTVWLAKKD
ncbi:class I SAM-dependent methyltransferase [Spirosoma koreense]